MLSRADSNFRPLSPDAYLTLAVELSQSPSEASRRSAVDRAYYAAFLATRNELHRKGYLTAGRGPQIHTQVISAFTNLNKNAGSQLRNLRLARNRLTYQTGRATLPYGMTTETILNSARTIIQAARTLPPNRA